MADKESSPDKDPAERTDPKTDAEDEKHEHGSYRKHGYQGYPNNPAGGGIHTGTGFAGVDPLSSGDSGLPKPNIILDRTKQGVEDLGDEEKDK